MSHARTVLLVVALLLAAPILILAAVKGLYGGGQPFPDRSTAPAVAKGDVGVAATLDLPPGCVTVTSEGRVFFDTHPFAAPARFGAPHLFELVDGEARPWPSEAAQALLVAPFGITADGQGRLWLTEPATLDRSATRLLAFDLESGELVAEHVLPDGDARFAQDLRVSPDGRHVVLADTGAFAFTRGALVVVDSATGEIVRTFQHPSLDPQDWIIQRYDGAPHRVAYGLVSFQVGVDGITFSADGRWLYYATMSHDTLYRLPASLLLDSSVANEALAEAIEVVGLKPQSDGITISADGRVLLTDVEHGGIAEVAPDGTLRTLTASDRVVWADSVEIGPDGMVWFTDSAIPAYLRQDLSPAARETFEGAAPYHLYRFRLP